MFRDYDDRLIAEEALAEVWAEIQADDEALRLWEEAHARGRQINEEMLALIEQDGIEIPF